MPIVLIITGSKSTSPSAFIDMVSSTPAPDYIVTDRGGIVENRYSVHCAVVDQTGRILYTCGDPNRLTLARSAAKPAQALAVLEIEGFDKYGYDDVDLALIRVAVTLPFPTRSMEAGVKRT